jgi:hypothetical protein
VYRHCFGDRFPLAKYFDDLTGGNAERSHVSRIQSREDAADVLRLGFRYLQLEYSRLDRHRMFSG